MEIVEVILLDDKAESFVIRARELVIPISDLVESFSHHEPDGCV